MKSYFKYTNGEAFTLNDQDYTGFLHITDGVVYSGKVDSDDMDVLVPKGTYMSNFILNSGDFNTTFRNIDRVSPFFSNVNDIVSLQGIMTMLRHLNNNNLICFKNLVIGHPVVYQLEENNNFYYSISSSSDTAFGRYETSFPIPFSEAISNPLSVLDEVTTGSFTISPSEDFSYFISNGIQLLVLNGSFVDPAPLEIVDSQNFHTFPPAEGNVTDFIYNITHDEDASRLYIVFNDTINIYDTTSFANCQSLESLLLEDIISIGGGTAVTTEYIWNSAFSTFGNTPIKWTTRFTIDNPNYSQYVKIGNNLRTFYNPLSSTLTLYNKYSDDVVLSALDLRSFGISALYSIDIRNTDDNILMLYKHHDESTKILYIDPETREIENSTLFSILSASDRLTIKFSGIDSDMFYVSTPFEYQTRFLSAPEWPCGRMEMGDLNYPKNYTWGRNPFNWINALFPFGYRSSPANNYNNLISPEIIKNDKMYMLLHNIGRVYALNQSVDDRFLNLVPLDTPSSYEDPVCSESTLGVYFNMAIFKIVRDLILLYSKALGKFDIHERFVVIEKLGDLQKTSNDLYINGNETFNVLSIQRILLTINDLQVILQSKSIEN